MNMLNRCKFTTDCTNYTNKVGTESMLAWGEAAELFVISYDRCLNVMLK